MITHPRFTAIYVADQQRVLEFCTEILGFELLTDAPFGDDRWIEVRPPGAQSYLVIAQGDPQLQAAVREKAGPMSYVWFNCDDLDATFEELRAKGVEFPVEPSVAPWDPSGRTRWAQFVDPEGTVYGVSQQEA